ncbi:multidrug RND transporter [Pseudoxanthomonas gei]|uniref:Multidrug RND transporter n=1 Tax=Pseudoxanthomonas gei TaxID=1383030 RepID=A0ABX0AGZ7_9GAMM|nr:efflux transporter outer membrane subunit [Pseudoxanthomonas gei]NDK38786.1 multidrug RND transporter [Pseudoxanthomonas gei]
MRTPSTTHAGRPVASALVLGLLLAGCASTHGLAPDARPLDGDALASTRSLSGHELSAANFPAQDWWSALGDPQLDSLIVEALQGTPSLEAADARLRKAQAQAGLADEARKPTLSASAQYSGVQLPETLLPPPEGGSYLGSTVVMFNFKYGLDLWGGKRAQFEAAVGQARAAEVDAQAARLTLASNIARAYVGLAQAHAALDVVNREHERASRLRGLGEQRVRAGLDNQLQLRQAESIIGSAQQQAQAAQQQIDMARTMIAALMGQGPDRGLAITRPAILQAGTPGVPAVLPSELLGHRPDVVAARWRVEAAGRGIDASKASFKPSINLSAIVGLASAGLSDLFSSDGLLGLGGPAISLPIFDGGRLRGQLDASDADYDLAVANYNQSLVAALHEVTDALQAARSLDQQVDSSRRALAASKSAWSLAQARYRAGLGTQLDVLAAQRPLLQLEQQIAGLQAQRLNATIDLDRALGGGLVLEQPTSPIANTVATP